MKAEVATAANGLEDDLVYRGALIALRLWRTEGTRALDSADYRDSAVSWLKLAVERLEATKL